jgi:hypothetical protein
MPDESPGSTQTVPPNSAAGSFRKRTLVVVAVIVLVAAIAAQLIISRADLSQVKRLSATVLSGVLLLQVIAQLAWNAAMWLPLRQHMKELGFWELLMVRAGGFLVGSVIPVAGNIGVRLAYLRSRGLAYAHFAWATLLTNSVALLSVGGVAVLSAGYLWSTYGPLETPVVGLTMAVFALGIAAVVGFHVLPRLADHRWVPKRGGWAELGQLNVTPQVFTWVFVFSLARHAGNFLSFGLLYQALASTPAAMVAGGLVYAITSPVRVVQIVPGNIGINEWIVALVGGILSYDLTTGLLVAVVFRGMTLIAQALAALAGSWFAIRSQT